MEGNVNHRVRQVKEEGLFLVAADEVDGVLGVEGRQLILIGSVDIGIGEAVLGNQRQFRVVIPFMSDAMRLASRSHVIGIGEAEVFVKALVEWEEAFFIAEVPFAEDARGVVLLLTDFGKGGLLGGQTGLAVGAEGTEESDTVGITAGQQGAAAGRADRLGRIETGELRPFLGELIEMRRGIALGAEGPDVAVAEVIHVDDDDVGAGIRAWLRASATEEEAGQKAEIFHHNSKLKFREFSLDIKPGLMAVSDWLLSFQFLLELLVSLSNLGNYCDQKFLRLSQRHFSHYYFRSAAAD